MTTDTKFVWKMNTNNPAVTARAILSEFEAQYRNQEFERWGSPDRWEKTSESVEHLSSFPQLSSIVS
jgi:hypothetical protein